MWAITCCTEAAGVVIMSVGTKARCQRRPGDHECRDSRYKKHQNKKKWKQVPVPGVLVFRDNDITFTSKNQNFHPVPPKIIKISVISMKFHILRPLAVLFARPGAY